MGDLPSSSAAAAAGCVKSYSAGERAARHRRTSARARRMGQAPDPRLLARRDRARRRHVGGQVGGGVAHGRLGDREAHGGATHARRRGRRGDDRAEQMAWCSVAARPICSSPPRSRTWGRWLRWRARFVRRGTAWLLRTRAATGVLFGVGADFAEGLHLPTAVRRRLVEPSFASGALAAQPRSHVDLDDTVCRSKSLEGWSSTGARLGEVGPGHGEAGGRRC